LYYYNLQNYVYAYNESYDYNYNYFSSGQGVYAHHYNPNQYYQTYSVIYNAPLYYVGYYSYNLAPVHYYYNQYNFGGYYVANTYINYSAQQASTYSAETYYGGYYQAYYDAGVIYYNPIFYEGSYSGVEAQSQNVFAYGYNEYAIYEIGAYDVYEGAQVYDTQYYTFYYTNPYVDTSQTYMYAY